MVMKKIDSIDEMEDVASASKTIEQVAKQIESTRKAWGNSSVRYWGQAPMSATQGQLKISYQKNDTTKAEEI